MDTDKKPEKRTADFVPTLKAEELFMTKEGAEALATAWSDANEGVLRYRKRRNAPQRAEACSTAAENEDDDATCILDSWTSNGRGLTVDPPTEAQKKAVAKINAELAAGKEARDSAKKKPSI